jgi:hypothetical protein
VTGLALAAALVASCGEDAGPAVNQPTPPPPGGQAVTRTFTSSGPILIPAGAPGVTQGPANPYPSTMQVFGMPIGILDVKVTVHRFSHTSPEDVSLLVVGPKKSLSQGGSGGSAHSAVLMSHAGCGRAITAVTLTFDARSGEMLPDATLIFSGTYHPTDYEPGTLFGAPAPDGPHGVALEIFAGDDPNGIWSLFALDRTTGNVGLIGGGWSLEITSGGSQNGVKRPSQSLTVPAATAAPTPCEGGGRNP